MKDARPNVEKTSVGGDAGFGALGLTDHEILEREFIVYDALYAECLRQVNPS